MLESTQDYKPSAKADHAMHLLVIIQFCIVKQIEQEAQLPQR